MTIKPKSSIVKRCNLQAGAGRRFAVCRTFRRWFFHGKFHGLQMLGFAGKLFFKQSARHLQWEINNAAPNCAADINNQPKII